MPNVIAFTGKKGVGKNYLAGLTSILIEQKKEKIQEIIEFSGNLEKRYEPYIDSFAFADPIKKFLIEALGVSEEHLYGNDQMKNSPTKYSWNRMPKWIQEKFGIYAGSISARQIMQIFGTEVCREIWGQDVWINAMRRRIDKSQAAWILVTDCRFQDEIDAIKEMNGKVWKINGPQRGDDFAKIDNHSSEKVMDFTTNFDYTIYNGLEDNPASLNQKIREAMLTGFELRI